VVVCGNTLPLHLADATGTPEPTGLSPEWVLALIGGGVAAALVLTGGSSKTKATGTLLDVVVPSEVASACTTQKVPKPNAVETDVCEPPSGALSSFPDNLEFSFYPSGSTVLSAYAAEKAKSGVKDNTGRCDRSTWKGEGIWHHPDGKLGGHRVCWIDGNGAAVIAWTHEKRGSDNHADMLGISSDPGRGAQTGLFSWWNPTHQVIGKCRAKVAEQTCVDTINAVTAK